MAEKNAFRKAVRERRCLIPASGFHEWTKDEHGNRLPWVIHRVDGAHFAFAGIWQEWRPTVGGDAIATCAIVTTATNAALSDIHMRMPGVVAASDWPPWLGEADPGAATLIGKHPRVATDQVEPYPA